MGSPVGAFLPAERATEPKRPKKLPLVFSGDDRGSRDADGIEVNRVRTGEVVKCDARDDAVGTVSAGNS